jgi:hypothetical protein
MPAQPNFRYYALSYLNDWCESDRFFVKWLAPVNERGVRLQWLDRAAKYYKVSRNFDQIAEIVRYDRALTVLDGITHAITDDNVSETVWKLAEQFRSIYRKYALSAASKFLWIHRHQSPVIIYDGQARKSLIRLGSRLREGY